MLNELLEKFFGHRIRKQSIESELPFALRYFASLLELGLTPEEALQRTSEMNFGHFSKLLNKILIERKKGKMLERSLKDAEATVNSTNLRESFSIIVQTLRLGSTPEAIQITRRLAQKLIDDKKRQYQTFGSKTQLTVLGQIALGALVPAVLTFFITIGGFLSNAPALIYLIYLIILPALSILMFVYLKVVSP